jgi:hypothetical protein
MNCCQLSILTYVVTLTVAQLLNTPHESLSSSYAYSLPVVGGQAGWYVPLGAAFVPPTSIVPPVAVRGVIAAAYKSLRMVSICNSVSAFEYI